MGLQDYDLYALKSYSFTVRKTNSFFSLPTVLLTISVFILAFLINLNTIRHLWIPLDELTITSSGSLEIPSQFTSTLLCLKPSDPANKEKIEFYRKDNTALTFPIVSEEEVSLKYPSFHEQMGTNYTCVNLQGFKFLYATDELNMILQDPAGTMYLKGTSTNEILSQKTDKAIEIKLSSSQKTAKLNIVIMKCTIYDRLYLNYEPQQINTAVSDLFYSFQETHAQRDNYSYFRIQLYSGDQIIQGVDSNLIRVNIYRKNLGEIFGAFLSWVSIFAIIIGFIAGPLMDKTLNLLTAESLYHLQPHMQNPSLLKFLVASLKQGIFSKEDRYVKMCNQIEKMKDVSTIVKLQALFSRLIPRSRTRPSQELIASQHNFNQVAKTQVGVDLFTDARDCKPLTLDVSEDEKEQNCLMKLKREVLCMFDEGSDPVSVTYNKGGIGSKKSFCVTLIAVLGLLVFLMIFGLLKSDSSIDRFNSEQLQQTLTIPQYTLFFGITRNQPIGVTILDGDHQIIESIPLTQSECKNKLSSQILVSLQRIVDNIFCISTPIQLVRSETPSKERIIRLNSENLTFSTYYFFPNVPDNKYIQTFSDLSKLNKNYQTILNYDLIKFTKINIKSPEGELQAFFSNNKQVKSNALLGLTGAIIRLSDSSITIEESQASFFDAVENIWTFTIVCFTIIVMKMTKYINLQQKQESRSPEKTEFRDSICIFLARMNGLLHGRHRQELEHMQHYVKEPLPLD